VHAFHASLGATFAVEGGWEVPESYPREHESTALTAVAVADVTARGKIDLQGRIDAVLTRAEADDWVSRIAADRALLFLGPGQAEARMAELGAVVDAGTMVTDVTHLLAGFALLGPGIEAVLQRLTAFDAAALDPGSGCAGPFAGVPAVFLRPALPIHVTEVYVGAELGRYVWESVLRVCRRLGGGPVGWRALKEQGWR
jgi:aminomethyltransferase